MKLPWILVGLLLAGGGTAWLVQDLGGGEPAATGVPEDGLFTVRRGTLTVTLTENGTLVAKESRKVAADVRGNAKITFLADEGTTVAEDEVICRLDATELEERLRQRQMDVVQSKADLETAQTDLEIQQAENVANLEKSVVAVDKARKELERYTDGDAPKERRKLGVTIKEAETEYTRTRKRWEDSQLLMSRNYINKSQLEEDEINFERAEVQRESAVRDLELFDTYTFPMTLTERQMSVKDAERNQETVAKRSQSQLRQREVAVEKNSTRLQTAEEQVQELEEDIAKMTLVAPSPGIVIHGDPQRPWERDRIRVGGDVWGNMTILTIPDLRVMQVKLRIHEADISKLTAGQKAKVTMDSYPGLVLDGKVSKIASIASGDNPWDDDPEVKKFDVEVTLDTAPDLELKPGISAKAEVFIQRKDDVVHVPLQCVFLEEGRHWCYVVDARGVPSAVEVEPGLSNDSYLEILSGLQEGQRVLLYNPNLPTGAEPRRDEPEEDADGDAGDADGAGEGGGEATTTAEAGEGTSSADGGESTTTADGGEATAAAEDGDASEAAGADGRDAADAGIAADTATPADADTAVAAGADPSGDEPAAADDVAPGPPAAEHDATSVAPAPDGGPESVPESGP